MKTREFVKLSPSFWTGPTGRQLRKAGAEAQLVALYLLSSPHTNYMGLFQIPVSYISNDTGLNSDAVRKALAAIEQVGFARYDESSECAWVVEGAKWQLGELKAADKRVTFLQKEFDALPTDCPFRPEFLSKYARMLCLRGSAAAPAPKQAELQIETPKAPKPTAKAAASTQEPEPEPEPEPDFNNDLGDAEDKFVPVFVKPADDEKYKKAFLDDYNALASFRHDSDLSTSAGDKEHAAAFLKIAAEHGYALAHRVVWSCLVMQDYGTANIPARVREALSSDIDDI